MRIAVVGSGIAGLAAAWLLRQEHEVTLFEQNGYFGGHSHTVEVVAGTGAVPVDTGFIVYNETNYPNLATLFEHLGVATQPSDMSFGVSIDGGRIEYAGDNLFGQRRNWLRPSHYAMIVDILRFNRLGKRILQGQSSERRDSLGESLGEFLDTHRFSASFRERYLLPMAAAIWSCPTQPMLNYPLGSFLWFFDNHGLLQLKDRPRWRTVCGGSQHYVQRMLQDLDPRRMHREARIAAVQRSDDGVLLRDEQGEQARFDQVVLACHPDQSRELLYEQAGDEAEILGAFRYHPNSAVLHTDTRLLPRQRVLWSSWNYLARQQGLDAQAVSVSYWMNRLQSIPGATQYIVSINPLWEPAPETVIKQLAYEHPVIDRATLQAQARLEQIQGRGGVWYCGAWCGHGFHEDGLRSAMNVGGKLGVSPPWTANNE